MPTHAIGRALLAGEWELAVALVLAPDGTGEAQAPARLPRDVAGVKAALRSVPGHAVAERAVLAVRPGAPCCARGVGCRVVLLSGEREGEEERALSWMWK